MREKTFNLNTYLSWLHLQLYFYDSIFPFSLAKCKRIQAYAFEKCLKEREQERNRNKIDGEGERERDEYIEIESSRQEYL